MLQVCELLVQRSIDGPSDDVLELRPDLLLDGREVGNNGFGAVFG